MTIMKVQIMILMSFVFLQNSSEVKFGYKGKRYSFNLPSSDYEFKEAEYKEGFYKNYDFEGGARIMLHVGGNTRKPILSSKNYIIQERSDTSGVQKRQGFKGKSKNKLYWGEITICNKEITILFDDVKQENLNDFIKSINSLKVNL